MANPNNSTFYFDFWIRLPKGQGIYCGQTPTTASVKLINGDFPNPFDSGRKRAANQAVQLQLSTQVGLPPNHCASDVSTTSLLTILWNAALHETGTRSYGPFTREWNWFQLNTDICRRVIHMAGIQKKERDCGHRSPCKRHGMGLKLKNQGSLVPEKYFVTINNSTRGRLSQIVHNVMNFVSSQHLVLKVFNKMLFLTWIPSSYIFFMCFKFHSILRVRASCWDTGLFWELFTILYSFYFEGFKLYTLCMLLQKEKSIYLILLGVSQYCLIVGEFDQGLIHSNQKHRTRKFQDDVVICF